MLGGNVKGQPLSQALVAAAFLPPSSTSLGARRVGGPLVRVSRAQFGVLQAEVSSKSRCSACGPLPLHARLGPFAVRGATGIEGPRHLGATTELLAVGGLEAGRRGSAPWREPTATQAAIALWR